MKFLVDTNVLSELRKGAKCHPSVAKWSDTELSSKGGTISVLTIGEIQKGILLLKSRDPIQAEALEAWLIGLRQNFFDRILRINTDVALEWGRLNAERPLPAVDSMLAATANVFGLVLATRDINDLKNVPVQTVNPFEFS
jgi:hypothetical protein